MATKKGTYSKKKPNQVKSARDIRKNKMLTLIQDIVSVLDSNLYSRTYELYRIPEIYTGRLPIAAFKKYIKECCKKATPEYIRIVSRFLQTKGFKTTVRLIPYIEDHQVVESVYTVIIQISL